MNNALFLFCTNGNFRPALLMAPHSLSAIRLETFRYEDTDYYSTLNAYFRDIFMRALR